MDRRVVVYIEKVDRKNGYVLLDFPVDKGETDFYQNFLDESGAIPDVEDASMLELHNVEFEPYGTPREGLYYEMPTNLLNENVWNQGVVQEDEDTPYIAFKVSTEIAGPLNFGNALRYWQFVQETDADRPDNLTDTLEKFNRLSGASNNIKLIVRNIGQGNMNEIHFASESFILYDIGAKRTSDLRPRLDEIRTQYLRIKRINQVLDDTPAESFRGFVLSHWDIDHYNGLLYVRDQDLDEFELFVVPQKLPTKTSRKAFDRLATRNVLAVPMRTRAHIRNATRFQPIFRNNIFTLYRGSKHYNRNKSGLTITAHKNNADVLLSGDTHYHQIDDYMLTHCNNDELYAVIPHHGGEAGDANRITMWNDLEEAAISVGYNQWDHPLQDVRDALQARIGMQNVHITEEENRDYIKRI